MKTARLSRAALMCTWPSQGAPVEPTSTRSTPCRRTPMYCAPTPTRFGTTPLLPTRVGTATGLHLPGGTLPSVSGGHVGAASHQTRQAPAQALDLHSVLRELVLGGAALLENRAR